MKYFKYKEFKCNCCNKQEMNKQFLLFLDELRARCSFPFRVTSGWRCENKQKDLARRGYHTIKNSAHLKGLAADIAVSDSVKRALFVAYAIELSHELKLPFRMGIAGKDKGHFIHIDIDETKTNPRMWIY